jgi:hypothetical protein
MNEHPDVDEEEARRRLEEAKRVYNDEALSLAHLADKVSMSSKRRAEMESKQDQPPGDPA